MITFKSFSYLKNIYKNNYKNDNLFQKIIGTIRCLIHWCKINIKIQQVFCSICATRGTLLLLKQLKAKVLKKMRESFGLDRTFPPSNFFVVSRQGWSNSRGRECLRFKMYAPSRPEIAVGLQKNGSARSTGRSIKRNWWRITRPARSSVFTIHS